MTTKEAVIDLIRRLPDDATIDDIMEELYVRCRIEAGIRQADEGQVISHEEVRNRMLQ